MLPNSKMTEGRFARWAKYRAMLRNILTTLRMGGEVHICTALKATRLTLKHADMLKATRNGLWLQRGRNWVSIDGCVIRHWRPKVEA